MENEKYKIETLKKLDDAYYNNKSLVTDKDYDELRDRAQKQFPDNDYFKTVGAPVNYGKKIKHETPMLSLNKAKTIDEVKKWLKKIGYTGKICVQPKIDGLSGVPKYDHTGISYIATRGGGEEGRDVTHVKEHIKDFPELVSTPPIFPKGEFYLPKYNEKFKDKLRNNCSGIINRKSDLEDLKHVRFVTYNIEAEDLLFEKESEKILELERLGFHTVQYYVIEIDELEHFYTMYLDVYRDQWNYETDGIVITVEDVKQHAEINSKYVVDHHNHFQIALKPPSQGKETTLLDIEWNLSRHGNLIPVAIFDPIDIDGIQIQRCTLHNYEMVLKEKLRKGNIIHILRSNDVIPYYDKKVSDGRLLGSGGVIPTVCPSCQGPLQHHPINKTGVHLHCPNKKCPEQIFQQILYYCTKSELDGIAESTLRLLYDNGYIINIISLFHLHSMMPDKLQALEGMGEKKVANLIEQIEKSRTCSISEFIDRLGIQQVGKKAVKKMGIKTLDDFWNYFDNQYIIGQKLIQYRMNNKDFIESLIKILNISEEKDIINSKGDNKMEKVVMTGKGHDTRKNLNAILEEKGYEVQDRINKETNILICEDPEGGSSKLQAARKLNVHIVSYDEFFKGE